MDDCQGALNDRGFCLSNGSFGSHDEAFEAAHALVDMCSAASGTGKLAIIGDFSIPFVEGPASRDFQTLHFDFGLPLVPKIAQDVARYSALHIPRDRAGTSAITRLVPLVALLRQRSWPRRSDLLDRFIAYGRTHGARDDSRGYAEGSFARIIDAAAAAPPLLPSVKADPHFLCGLEFDTGCTELEFFQRHGLDVESVATDIALRPGQLLVFDNLALAHGRRGQRQPGELQQRVFGHRLLGPARQAAVRERVLDAFCQPPLDDRAPAVTVSIP